MRQKQGQICRANSTIFTGQCAQDTFWLANCKCRSHGVCGSELYQSNPGTQCTAASHQRSTRHLLASADRQQASKVPFGAISIAQGQQCCYIYHMCWFIQLENFHRNALLSGKNRGCKCFWNVLNLLTSLLLQKKALFASKKVKIILDLGYILCYSIFTCRGLFFMPCSGRQ